MICACGQCDGGLTAENEYELHILLDFCGQFADIAWSAGFVLFLTAVFRQYQIIQTLCTICCHFVIKN